MNNICSQYSDSEISEIPEDIICWLELNHKNVSSNTACRLFQLHDELRGYFGTLYPYSISFFSKMDDLIKCIELGYSNETILANVFYYNGFRLEQGQFSLCSYHIDLIKFLRLNCKIFLS